MDSKGKLIVIDGIDGSGKGTQAALLLDILHKNGIKAELFDFPRYGEKSAVLVEEYLNGNFGTAAEVGPYRGSVFYTVDRFAVAKKMKDLLDQGIYILSNRYVSASKGHQAASIDAPSERKAYLDWLNDFEYNIFGIPLPDMTIFLHVSSEIGYELVLKKQKREYLGDKKQDILEEDKAHQQKAEKAYLEMAQGLDTVENWKIVECCERGKILSIDEISQKIVDLVNTEFSLAINGEV